MLRKICCMMLALAGSLYSHDMQKSIEKSIQIIQDFKKIPEQTIPIEVLKNARGLAIINVIKGGFFVSGKAGLGLVIAKTADGSWSAPSAVEVAGGGFGYQFGVEITDFILLLNTQEAVDAFAKDFNFTLGADISIAAGPMGRTLEGDISPSPVAAIYSYSRSQGLFAGVSLEGTLIAQRNGINRQFYKKAVTAQELLSGSIPPPAAAAPLYDELNMR